MFGSQHRTLSNMKWLNGYCCVGRNATESKDTNENGQSPRPGDIIQESLDELNVSLRGLPEQWKLRPQRQADC